MTDQPTTTPKASEAKPKKLNAQRTQARKDFKKPDPNKLRELETEFDSYKPSEHGNVSIYLQEELQDRLALPYVQASDEFATVKNLDQEDRQDLQYDTQLMANLAVSKKLLQSMPESSMKEVLRWDDLKKDQYFIPPNLWALIANLGKFDQDDYVVRYPYGGQDVNRTIIKALKNFNRRRGFQAYQGIIVASTQIGPGMDQLIPWNEVQPAELVWPIDSSTQWIRDQSKRWLTSYLSNPIQVNVDIGEGEGDEHVPLIVQATFSYPYIDLEGSSDVVLDRIAVWSETLIDGIHPDRQAVVAAALMTIWETRWSRNITMTFADMGVHIPIIEEMHSYEALALMNVKLVIEREWHDDNSSEYLEAALRHLSKKQRVFNDFLEMIEMPRENAFGTVAQLAPITNDMMQLTRDGEIDFTYYRIKNNVVSNVFHRYADTGSIVAGVIGGFTSRVDFHPNFETRIRSNPQSLLTRTLRPDIKRLA